MRGGSPRAGSIFYRDDLVDRLVDALGAGESIVLTAEKRVGKTGVMRVLEARSDSAMAVVYRDVEGVGSPRRLAELVTEDVRPFLGAGDRARHRLRSWCEKLGGTTVGPVTLPEFTEADWAAHLNTMFDALSGDLEEEDRTLVLVWDEAPWMIAKVRRDCGWEVAADLLDELRAIRDRHPRVRFVFTGSIGFHHVLRDLRDGRSHHSALNTMSEVDLPPLTPDDAGRLARRLLGWIEQRGATFDVPAADVAEHIAAVCDGVPYFMHATVDDLAKRSGVLGLADVDAVITAARFSPNDSWNLGHYETRLEDYYGSDADRAGLVLDAVALRGTATTDEVVADLSHSGPGHDRGSIRPLLQLLHSDHYLSRDGTGWRFTYGLIREAWLDRRDLRTVPTP
jgi:hypothetical protein